MARYRQEKAAYDAEMARRAAQSDEAAQADAQTAPRRRRVNGALPLRRLVRMRDRQAERKASSPKTDLLHLFLLT